MDIRSVIGLNVLRIRRERRLTQEELAFRLTSTRAYISGLEAGKRNPTILTLVQLSEALGVDLDDLLRRNQKIDK
ncbi:MULTISPECIES: helix-turn-helix domain-containing protein [Brucella/Ochrobactrum group]|uniref:Helix-turn-helix transcriptional regulator n=1 Tax=Ochrobactrum soli TaxID=2448455 RepID=A0A849KMJ7_9HYPH|nr:MULTISPECIES: helix-turn-helix transcriptional regulator [Brucella]MDH7784862.1 transcriptional regulator with XRE-family HTH domain [Ochrobactrum sp. 19YEA23]NNU63105.1 helix-turn-helix transcriptional regulator [[Ochrobactrum] soli]WHS32562.1 helix-turn-helix transcriptional regulator [Brucella sp. NM4]WHT42949.1 helix-turn-helix transcriptional regulator [Ochrobactrum sp. SSR]